MCSTRRRRAWSASPRRRAAARPSSSVSALRLSALPGRSRRGAVNQVPLVHQQAQVISENSTLSVGKLFGELGLDTWSASQWHEMLDGRFDVLVATPQCVLTGRE